MTWTRTQMISLWPYTLNNVLHIWNNMPDCTSGLSPYEKFTGTKLPQGSNPLLSTRVWGCPAFVLNATLQDSIKLPKFKKRSRCGVYLGHSPTHSHSIKCILNPETGHISPQYHVVYDKLFPTVWARCWKRPLTHENGMKYLSLRAWNSISIQMIRIFPTF